MDLIRHVPPSLVWPAQFCAFTIAATFIVSVITGNVSQVDRLWTFLPTIYTAYYAFLPLFPNHQSFFLEPFTPKALGWSVATQYSPRALLMFGLVFIWMCRLSYNTYRRGLFNPSDEDYRWQVLRGQLHPVLFQITNLVFIAGIQNVLLLLLGLPTRTAAMQAPASLAPSDYALAAAALVVLAVEFTADNQQYAFHAYKHAHFAKKAGKVEESEYNPAEQWPGARLNWKPEDAERGFVTRGLWAYSRHPNFNCEQGFWWIITLFPLLAPEPPHLPSEHDFPPLRTVLISLASPDLRKPLFDVLYTALYPTMIHLLPAIALSALFFSSTLFTESISAKKYPKAYTAYQKRVGMFTPSGTLCKKIKLYLFASRQARDEIDRLVWGPVERADKTE
ncbi:hypothetical protein D9611_001596 [Ephemerocybe angulata]|uniref:DUF1295-domain-containing protein n=1 Tax=Ephemerocybe angulata TaxID=980116 RepID=A0A8H5FMP9_9AGAR|nr:hypothetical protein D9611_001596 [Tulosesus angulatus]